MDTFYKGMDISSLLQRLDNNMQLFDENHEPVEAFDLLRKYNVNSIRIRIWNEPERVPESGGYCSLSDTVKMAKMIKQHNMHFMLDFHYSDWWADPGQQRKPAAWENLEYEALKAAVHDYTAMVLKTLEAENCLPDVVQIGNEIRSGMLFPEGEVPNYKQLAELINEGIAATREVSEDIEVMIHLDQGGRYYYLKEWFDAVFAEGLLPIDCIGISFYPFWHGTFMDLKASMEKLVERYKLPVYVVETAHPWTVFEKGHITAEQMKTAGIPAGIEEQKKSLDLVFHIVDSIPNNMGKGVYYWEPLCVPGKDPTDWAQDMGMLDAKGRPYPSFEVYRDFERGHVLCDDLVSYMEKLYQEESEVFIPHGTNLVRNGDFSEGMESWWSVKTPDSTEVKVENGEVYINSQQNFKYDLFKEVFIEKSGKYQMVLDYRGTNTTGVKIQMYVKRISCDGEEIICKEIFPSDIDWVAQVIDNMELERGTVRLGISVDAPPIFGRIRNIRLYKVD